MNTKEFKKKLELDVAKLELREKVESDPVMKKIINKKKERRSNLLENINQRCCVAERATVDNGLY